MSLDYSLESLSETFPIRMAEEELLEVGAFDLKECYVFVKDRFRGVYVSSFDGCFELEQVADNFSGKFQFVNR